MAPTESVESRRLPDAGVLPGLLLRAILFDQDSPPTIKTRPLRPTLAPYGQDSPLASQGVEEEEDDACFFLHFYSMLLNKDYDPQFVFNLNYLTAF